MSEEAQSQDELKIVGYTTVVDEMRYTSTLVDGVKYWMGLSQAPIEPVVLKSEADAKIKDLSDMVISLSETQATDLDPEQILTALEKLPARIVGDVFEVEALDHVPGNEEVVHKLLNKVAKEGLKEIPVKAELIFLPEDLDQNTKELVSIFALSMALKLLRAKKKYGYTDGWRQGYAMEDCLQDFQEHVEKGDPRDVAAFCAFMWYHGWSTNGNSTKTS